MMLFSCSKADLLKGIQTIQSAVSSRATLPILSHILIKTHKKQLYLASTDLEIGIECFIPAQITKEGSVTAPARKIGDIIKELPDAEVNIAVKNKTITINCQRGIYKIAGSESEDFPKIPQLDAKTGFVLKQGVLRNMIQKTVFAASHDETRYALNGIFFVAKEGKIRMVATDGRRLACIEREVNLPRGTKKEIIIPTKTANNLFRLLEEEEKEVKIIFGENQIAFHLENTRVVSRLIEGHFPEYQKVVPKKFKEKIVLPREALSQALKRVAVLTSDKTSSVRIDISSDKLLLTAITPEVGEAREEIDIKYKGEDLSIAFNPIYMLDFLKNETGEEVCLELTDPLSPGVMRPESQKEKQLSEENYFYVIMPMKL